MEGLQGPINSFFLGEMGFPQMSFLQMLNAKHQSEEEGEGEGEGYEAVHEEDDKTQLHFQIQQLLRLQSCYSHQTHPSMAFEQIESCVTQSETKAVAVANVGPKEKRKRSRAAAAAATPAATTKNPQEIEAQRMNHIAVERNRRKLMNSHLNSLRALMPPSFVHGSDQASIISGAIDFVKEHEQLLVSLQAKKRMRPNADTTTTASSSVSSASCTDADDEACHIAPPRDFLTSPQHVSYSKCQRGADVEATVMQGHANLKVLGRKKQGQLVRAIAALEEIGLSVMHLNINTLDACSILYSLNLKIEEESKLRSADEIATVVHQIFSYINDCD